ncbi:GAF domain-containing protein [Paracoccus sp. Z118]|uniref:GAF domain-containing protein n=1 Tax=Paracoccus sp. Z118 TaxID=2851017 RepID=UPI001C2BB5EE|nr:GAF domain-containing protein [Paracoccus sp. Z118]MBV0893531.1 GAF domain-containing protein [Paracoccus sp. Z118]
MRKPPHGLRVRSCRWTHATPNGVSCASTSQPDQLTGPVPTASWPRPMPFSICSTRSGSPFLKDAMAESTPPMTEAEAPQGTVTQEMVDACAQEQIQFLGHVQDFGCLLVVTTQWVVRNASANCGSTLGLEPEALVAQRLTDVLPASTMHTLRGKVQVMGRNDQGIRLFGLDVFEDGRRFDIAIHRDGPVFLVEFERKQPDRVRDPGAVVQALIPRLTRAVDHEELCTIAADAVWALTGFDRVMVYRFESDFSGVVVGETLSGGADSYMGHRFPASDIPPQARALYKRNLIRIIADVDAPVHPIVPPHTPDGAPTDLSLSITRAVSPIHLQYLRNMGVRASMSVSILVEGELWGMLACHREQPHYVDYETRSAIELFAQLLAYELGLRTRRDESRLSAAALEAHDQISIMFESSAAALPDLAGVSQEIERVFDVDGIAMMMGGHYHATGLAPSRDEFGALMHHVARNGTSRVFNTDNLGRACAGAFPSGQGIGGMLAIPIHSRRGDGVILFRRELTRDLIWAGPPSKERLPDGRLSPRASFSTWREERRGFSESWTAGELAASEVLRVSLLEITLRLSTDLDRRRTSHSERQEIVIAELTHRLRNVYSTVSAAIEGGADGAEPAVQAYAAEARSRLAAMKRASDVLTDRSRDSTSLRQLIRDEVRAYGGRGEERVEFVGGEAMLSPRQRSALTLVIHELTTNAVKYGALGPAGGRLEVRITARDNGVELHWRERGGPVVTTPQRVGFGSALVQHTIPQELGGTIETSFAPDGFEMSMHIPGLSMRRVDQAPAAQSQIAPVTADDIRISGRALVVEDNMIIAMNAAQSLRRLGAEDVVIAGSSEAALSALDEGIPVSFAVLDQDLNGLSSEPVAIRLESADVPFVVASGLVPDPGEIGGVLGRAVWIEKPYSSEAIGQALRRHFGDRFIVKEQAKRGH